MSRIVLVTGAAGGIGESVCRRLAADGFGVLAADLSAEAAARVVAGLPGQGHRAIALDVSDEAAVADAFAAAEAAGAPVEHVVAAAGILLFAANGDRPPITDISVKEWELTQRVNSTGTFLLLREYLRGATRRGATGGRFIGFASVAAQLGGYRSSAAYIASKGSVLALVKAGAREAAALGITVNAVAPGLIDAPMLRQSLPPEKDSTVAANIPLNRIGSPGDVAGAVSFLMGEDAGYITGAVIDVNGGYRMQ
ncbi:MULTISPECIES: SDR family NAD(P)-dependent oxidoreductase [Gemmobacter]|jgi:3-oxoacyl-[acyl-carrier protein] reductase|uniref:3-oxoacyl-[acyl-carrier protein] reductase n=1 Tax=Gemmobacter caeni TaxID=589035 RepID=A0A2T6ATD5_9RHOB|nr:MULTISPECIES: SDR family NAD(P)-dependent oxidoreductase [Gemmobacter]OJY36229.1 MAG: short-chain dehydrogenase [Rhodobacterales bacterium 65-51]PTX47084.1 3-oxoacyl-[acyl-carrier protein] reductase [Gemmobacter caeni]TWI96059.1 3-oxoacyl-[acyl-carrier protein] reductase [Gemmobacter caeni]